MSKRLGITKYLEKITDIEAECSVCDEQEICETEKNMETDRELLTTSELESDSDNKEENIINKRPGHKRKRF